MSPFTRYILFGIISLFAVSTANSQSSKLKTFWLCDTTIMSTKKMSGFETTDIKIVVNRDKFGRKTEFITKIKIINSNNFTISKREIYTYNTNGKITRELNMIWSKNNDEWLINSQTRYVYNDKEMLIEKVYENITGDYVICPVGYNLEKELLKKKNISWNIINKEKYFYDENGNQVIFISTIYMGGKEKNTKITSKYVNDLLLEEKEETKDYTMSSPEMKKSTFEYKDDKTVKKNVLNWDKKTNKWKQLKATEYKYKDGGSISEEIVYKFGFNYAGKWQMLHKEQIKYDLKQNITDKMYYDFDYIDEEWVLKQSYKYVFEYDQNDNLIRKTSKQKINDNWNDTDELIYFYDKYNNPVKRISKSRQLGKQGLHDAYMIEYKYRKYTLQN